MPHNSKISDLMNKQEMDSLINLLTKSTVTPQLLQTLVDARIITSNDKNAVSKSESPVQVLASKIQSNPSKVRKTIDILQRNESGISSNSNPLTTPRSQTSMSPTRRKEQMTVSYPQAKKTTKTTLSLSKNATFSRSQSVIKKQTKDSSATLQTYRQIEIEDLFRQLGPIYKVVMGSCLETPERSLRFEDFVSASGKVATELEKVKEDLVKKPDVSNMYELVTESLPLQKMISNQLHTSKKSFADYYNKLNSKMKGEKDKLIADKEELEQEKASYRELLREKENETSRLKEELDKFHKDYKNQIDNLQTTIKEMNDKMKRASEDKKEVEVQTETVAVPQNVTENTESTLKEMEEIHDVNIMNPSSVENILIDQNANFPVLNIRDLSNVSLVRSVSDVMEDSAKNRSRRSSISCVSTTSTNITQEPGGGKTIINKVFHVTFNVHNCQNVNIGSNVKYNRLGSA